MFEWIVENSWLLWLVLFLVLAGIEMVTLDLFFIMLSAGALAAMVTSLVTGSLVLQSVVFCAVALAMIVFVRPTAVRHLRKSPPEQRTNIDRLIGEMALTLEPVSESAGLVKIGGDTWTARSAGEAPIPAGATVAVKRIEGATAIVAVVKPASAPGAF